MVGKWAGEESKMIPKCLSSGDWENVAAIDRSLEGKLVWRGGIVMVNFILSFHSEIISN